MKTLFLAMFIAYGLGALAALVSGRKSFGRGLVALGAIAGAGAGLALGATVIATGVPFTLWFLNSCLWAEVSRCGLIRSARFSLLSSASALTGRAVRRRLHGGL